MPRIQANRDTIDDRFSVLGFTVRSESPLFEVAVATDPALFRLENRARRAHANFYSSRAGGVIPTRRGEAVYLVPPEVLANFAGQPRLYFGLATYREGSGGQPDFVQTPTPGNFYVNLSGLTERGLRRLALRPRTGDYGAANGHDPSLDWGGDAQPQPAASAQPPATATTRPANGRANGKANGSAANVPPAPYDDGFGEFPPPATPAQAGATTATTPATTPAASSTTPTGPAPTTPATPATPARAAALAARRPRPLAADEDDADDGGGIDGPIPDDEATAAAQALRSNALDAPQPEYPGASRFAPAHPSNYRAVSTPREIRQVVIHITDGGSRITGTIGWFQNPNQRNARNQPIHVSAHYVVGQDGEVVQMVHNNDIAWHANSANGHSIGIEHVANTHGLVPTQDEYRGSARLVAWLCQCYGLPIDRTHVLGHAEADPHTTHTDCPNAVWDWDTYMAMVREEAAALAQPAAAQSLGAYARGLEIITPFYDQSDPASALSCQDNAFSLAREEWFMGVGDTTQFPHSAICQLNMTAPNGDGYMGTGFYIAPNRILTCAHNLDGMASVTIVPGRNGAGGKPFGECTVQSSSWRIARPPYTGTGNWENDLAVIDNVPLAAPNGQFFRFLNATPSDRMPIVVCGYAAASDAVPELTQAIDADKQHLHGGYASSQSNLEVIEYPILTLHGNSGSPVYHLDDSSGTLQALVCAVHVTGQPAAQGLNRGCFITPRKIDWIEGRATAFAVPPRVQARRPQPRAEAVPGRAAVAPPTRDAARRGSGTRALENQSFSLHWDTVPYYAQQTDASCWAAAAAMVVAWRDGITLTDADIAAKVPALDAYRNGLWPTDRHLLADVWNLMPEPPACYTIDAWRDMLATYGPLYLDMTNSAGAGGHAWVLIGMTSDGAADGSDTVMYLHNPTASRGKVKWNFQDFQRLYEGRVATEGATLEYQILHAAAIPAGRQPVTAAPFSLGLESDLPPVTRSRAPQRGRTRALATETIEYPVQLIPQPDKLACWAASMAMLLGFRRNVSITPEALASQVGGSLMTSYGWDLLQAVRDRYGFTAIDVPSNTSLYFSPAQWAQWLRDLGPLWVVIVGMPHAVVVSGLRGNTDDPAGCEVKLLNPWDTRVAFDDDPTQFHPANQGYADWLPFQQFASDFGNMAEPDYGNWRVLHLPATAASAQALASAAVRRATASSRAALATPPRPVRAFGLEDSAPIEEPIEPSRVPGTTMRRTRGSRGRVTWALDQLDGVKLPDPSAAMVPALLPTTITLDQWPCMDRDAVPLPLSVRFDAGGGAVGNVRITAGAAADLPYDVSVTATISDEAQPLPGLSGPQAAVLVTIDADFSGAPGGNATGRTRLRLVGNGRYDLDSSWQ